MAAQKSVSHALPYIWKHLAMNGLAAAAVLVGVCHDVAWLVHARRSGLRLCVPAAAFTAKALPCAIGAALTCPWLMHDLDDTWQGWAYGFDAHTGKMLWSKSAGPGSASGGSQW
mgnify:CR=1 FL=1